MIATLVALISAAADEYILYVFIVYLTLFITYLVDSFIEESEIDV